MAKTPKSATGAKKAAKTAPKSAPKSADMKAPGTGKAPGIGKARGLGRGLSSLLGDAGIAATTSGATGEGAAPTSGPTPAPAQSGLTELPIEWINSGPWQPRRRFDTASLTELADSIRSKGLVQPILVRPRAGATNRYELIAGERRWRAAQMAQLHTVPAIIRDLEDEEAYELALIENVQRADLSAVEEAEGYRQLIDNFGYTQEQLSKIIGKSRSHIANLLRLLSLPPAVGDMIVNGRLTMGEGRPLIGHEDCVALAREVAAKGLSARQVEAMVARNRAGAGIPSKAGAKPAKSADIRDIEKKLQTKLGLRVDIEWSMVPRSGHMLIRLETPEQFEMVAMKLVSD